MKKKNLTSKDYITVRNTLKRKVKDYVPDRIELAVLIFTPFSTDLFHTLTDFTSSFLRYWLSFVDSFRHMKSIS